jgi:hypothetical protein
MLAVETEKVAIVRRTVCTCGVSSEERKRERTPQIMSAVISI